MSQGSWARRLLELLGLGALLAALASVELLRPAEYTVAIVRFEGAGAVADLWPGEPSLPEEVARHLCGPPWTPAARPGAPADGGAVALLLCGKLEDWPRNPQHVLEASVGRKVASLAYAHFADLHGCWGLPGRLARWYGRLAGRRWAASLELFGGEGGAPQDGAGEVRRPASGAEPRTGAASPCEARRRTLAGPVLQGNSGWRYVVLRSRAPEPSPAPPPPPLPGVQMTLEPL